MDPFVGQIMTVPYSFAPEGWAMSLGQQLSIQQNPALFAVVGNRFGGDGRVSFNAPNLGGRVILGANATYPLAQTGGQAAVTLTASQMPAHNHAANFTPTGSPTPVNFSLAGSFSAPVTVSGQLMANAALANDDNPTSGCTLGSVSPGSTKIYASSSGAAVPLAAVSSTGTVSGNLDSSASGSVTLPPVTGDVNINLAGGNQPVDILPPYIVLNPIIALTGVFPSQS